MTAWQNQNTAMERMVTQSSLHLSSTMTYIPVTTWSWIKSTAGRVWCKSHSLVESKSCDIQSNITVRPNQQWVARHDVREPGPSRIGMPWLFDVISNSEIWNTIIKISQNKKKDAHGAPWLYHQISLSHGLWWILLPHGLWWILIFYQIWLKQPKQQMRGKFLFLYENLFQYSHNVSF
jgi:hypothetical protein